MKKTDFFVVIWGLSLLLLLSTTYGPSVSLASGNSTKATSAVRAADEIIGLRSKRAGEFIKGDAEITPETFKAVCGAVKKRVMEIAENEGFLIRHAAVKRRNPRNEATEKEREFIERFEADRGLSAISDSFVKDGSTHLRITKPIYVEKACLACHGDRAKRPAFIVEKYSDDSAYGFKEGDLRGIISISFPNEG